MKISEGWEEKIIIVTNGIIERRQRNIQREKKNRDTEEDRSTANSVGGIKYSKYNGTPVQKGGRRFTFLQIYFVVK